MKLLQSVPPCGTPDPSSVEVDLLRQANMQLKMVLSQLECLDEFREKSARLVCEICSWVMMMRVGNFGYRIGFLNIFLFAKDSLKEISFSDCLLNVIAATLLSKEWGRSSRSWKKSAASCQPPAVFLKIRILTSICLLEIRYEKFCSKLAFTIHFTNYFPSFSRRNFHLY